MNWTPQALCDCADSEILAMAIGVMSIGVVVFYLLIARIWLQSSYHASDRARRTWQWLIGIFCFCAATGYGSLVLMIFWPEAGFVMRVGGLVLLWIACPAFLYQARRHKFVLHGIHEQIGEKMSAVKTHDMDDKTLAAFARTTVVEALKRLTTP